MSEREYVGWKQTAAREIIAHEREHPMRRPSECATCRLIALLDDCGERQRLIAQECPEIPHGY
jgi:hypothetical protein